MRVWCNGDTAVLETAPKGVEVRILSHVPGRQTSEALASRAKGMSLTMVFRLHCLPQSVGNLPTPRLAAL